MKKNNYFKYIVIAAVILIPFMYSFFYLKAYWDPYGKGNIDNIPVAIVNEDNGDKGEEIIDSIKKAKKLKLVSTTNKKATDGLYNNEKVVSENWIKEICKMQLETPSIYKKDRVLPKLGVGYYTFISRDGYIFRDGSNGQYIIVNKEKKLLITIMSSEKEMKNVTEILRNII